VYHPRPWAAHVGFFLGGGDVQVERSPKCTAQGLGPRERKYYMRHKAPVIFEARRRVPRCSQYPLARTRVLPLLLPAYILVGTLDLHTRSHLDQGLGHTDDQGLGWYTSVTFFLQTTCGTRHR
jgi:hypothetical protein